MLTEVQDCVQLHLRNTKLMVRREVFWLAVVLQEDTGEARVFVVTNAMSATTPAERGSLRLWLESAA